MNKAVQSTNEQQASCPSPQAFQEKNPTQVTDDEWRSRFSEITRYLLRKNSSNLTEKHIGIAVCSLLLFFGNHCKLECLVAHYETGSNEQVASQKATRSNENLFCVWGGGTRGEGERGERGEWRRGRGGGFIFVIRP